MGRGRIAALALALHVERLLCQRLRPVVVSQVQRHVGSRAQLARQACLDCLIIGSHRQTPEHGKQVLAVACGLACTAQVREDVPPCLQGLRKGVEHLGGVVVLTRLRQDFARLLKVVKGVVGARCALHHLGRTHQTQRISARIQVRLLRRIELAQQVHALGHRVGRAGRGLGSHGCLRHQVESVGKAALERGLAGRKGVGRDVGPALGALQHARQRTAVPHAGGIQQIDRLVVDAEVNQILAIAHLSQRLKAVALLEVDRHRIGLANLGVLDLALLLDEGAQKPHPHEQRFDAVEHLAALRKDLGRSYLRTCLVRASVALDLLGIEQLIALAHASGADQANRLAAAGRHLSVIGQLVHVLAHVGDEALLQRALLCRSLLDALDQLVQLGVLVVVQLVLELLVEQSLIA